MRFITTLFAYTCLLILWGCSQGRDADSETPFVPDRFSVIQDYLSVVQEKVDAKYLPDLEKSVRELSKARSISLDGMGFAGSIPREIDYCRCILEKSKDPERDFVQIFENGTTEGKLYALWVLSKLDSDSFIELKNQMDPSVEILCWSGCLSGASTVGEFLDKYIVLVQMGKNPESYAWSRLEDIL